MWRVVKWAGVLLLSSMTFAGPPRTTTDRASAWVKLSEELTDMAGPHRWIATTPSGWAAASFDTGLLPGNDETVIFGSWAQGDVISDLDQTAVDLDALQVQDGYFGRIGNHGNPLIISADLIIHRGRGTLHFQQGSSTTDLIIIDSDNKVNAAYISGADISRLRLLKGKTKLLVGIENVTDIEVSYRNDPQNDVILDALGLANAKPIVADLRMDGGTVFFHRPLIENIVVADGVLRVFYHQNTTSPQFTYQTGGRVVWTSFFASGATTWQTPEYHLLGGMLDISEGGQKTFTSLYVYKNGTLYDPNNNLTAASGVIQMAP